MPRRRSQFTSVSSRTDPGKSEAAMKATAV
jgi:hypothetical protein